MKRNCKDNFDSVFLMGPTGSGKSDLALFLCQQFPFEIISVDSVLVYRDLNIGAAKPTPIERRKVPHHLLDLCDLDEQYSVAKFCIDASRAVKIIEGKGKIPLFVGGTGLYFRRLVDGIMDLPISNKEVRSRLIDEINRNGTEKMHQRLRTLDGYASTKIHVNDRQRILRALEIYETTGETASSLKKKENKKQCKISPLKILVYQQDRIEAKRVIASRFCAMLDNGLVNEVRSIKERFNLSNPPVPLRTIGYKQVWKYLDGEIDFERMKIEAISSTIKFAKRQLTWFRKDENVAWLDVGVLEDLKSRVCHLISNKIRFRDPSL